MRPFLALLLLVCGNLNAAETAQVAAMGTVPPPEMEVERQPLEVFNSTIDGASRQCVKLRGTLRLPGVKVSSNLGKVTLQAKGKDVWEFSIVVPLSGQVTPLTLSITSAERSTFEQKFGILHQPGKSILRVHTPRIGGSALDDNRLPQIHTTQLNEKPPHLELSWDQIPGAIRYRLRWTKNPETAETDQEDYANEPKFESRRLREYLKAPFFRVEALTSERQVISSALQQLKFQFLSPPQTTPRADESFSLARVRKVQSGRVVLSWEKTLFTNSYELEVASDRDFKDIVYRGKEPTNFAVVPKLGSGDYWWRVSSENESFELLSGPSPARKFTIVN